MKKIKKSQFYKSLAIKSILACVIGILVVYTIGQFNVFAVKYDKRTALAQVSASSSASTTSNTSIGGSILSMFESKPALDKEAYDKKMVQLANNPIKYITLTATSTVTVGTTTKVVTTTTKIVSTSTAGQIWPVKTVYPNAGALLPFNRIVAYYGNFYSTKMGVLGEYPPDEMVTKLMGEVSKWQIADPSTPVIPAIDYIVSTAQGSPGDDGMYRLRMPDDQIQKALDLANQVHGVLVLDIQTGRSTVEDEVPVLEKYLKLPNVELALDPEFSMGPTQVPGSVIGTIDAKDVNWAANYLVTLTQANNLPPKILVVHRFTFNMVTNYKEITPLPDVQIVMDMDGWGTPPLKLKIYDDVIQSDPVQFTGIKLFYKNDLMGTSSRMLTTTEILNQNPQPSFIQYQ